MPKKLTIEEIQKRLQNLYGNTIKIVCETYLGTTKKAKFVHQFSGSWWSQAGHVIYGASTKPKLTVTPEMVQQRINITHNNNVTLDTKTYKNVHTKCKFIDKIFGEWDASPDNVMQGYGNPKRGKENFKKTCIQKYGFDNPTKNKEIRLKAARSANKITTLEHWNTKENIYCQGSYEVAVVNYFNAHKIKFLWQPKTFTLPDGRTYTPDCYLTEKGLNVEIKGRWYDNDSKEKWDWFHKEYSNSELWDEQALKEKGIL